MSILERSSPQLPALPLVEPVAAPAALEQPLRRFGRRVGETGRAPAAWRRAAWYAGLSQIAGRFAAVFLPISAVLSVSRPLAEIVWVAAVLGLIWLACLHSAYSGAWLSPLAIGIPLVTVGGTLLGLACVSAASVLLPGIDPGRNEILVMTGGIALASAVFEHVAVRRADARRRVVVVGGAGGGLELAEELAGYDAGHFDCVGIVDDAPLGPDAEPGLGAVDELAEVIARERPDIVVLAGVERREAAIQRLLDVAALDFRIVDVHHLYEHAFGRVPVWHLPPGWFVGVLHLYRRPYSRISKRIFDVTVASAALVVLAPLLVLAALLVRCSGPGPVLFRQVRMGEAGQPFHILKLRTMIDDAERDGIAVWAAAGDPRVTAIGRVLRRTRLDEVPQLWNVLRGEMSVVGPRPERPEFLRQLEAEVPFWMRRHLVKPGITGWAQLHCGYTSDAVGAAEKLSYDLYYLKHRTLLLDLAIAAKTALVVARGSGAR